MEWRIRWGADIAHLLDIQKETGTTPSALVNRPVLAERWQFADEVFSELSGSRRFTMGGPANIPFSEFYLYAVAHSFSRQETVEVWDDLRQMDNAWLSAVREKMEAEKGHK